jgi:creatinine amidohydrolase
VTLRRRWVEMSSADFAGLDPQATVAILPVGAVEQHGPHLPVYVDSCINGELLARLLAQAPPELAITALPLQTVGKSNEHQAYPGTLTHTAETLTRICYELGESVARAGLRKLVLLNSHGGQPQIMDIVARELRVRERMFVVHAGWGSAADVSDLFSADELKYGIHGGEAETSMMLHLRPDLVQMERAANFVSLMHSMGGEYRWLTPEGRVGFGWQSQDLHPSGASGNASLATAEKGRIMAERCVAGMIDLLGEVARYPLDRIADR